MSDYASKAVSECCGAEIVTDCSMVFFLSFKEAEREGYKRKLARRAAPKFMYKVCSEYGLRNDTSMVCIRCYRHCGTIREKKAV